MCYDILERKNPFLGNKKKVQEVEKTKIFRKRLTNGFGPKMAIFPWFFSKYNISQENV